MFLNKRNDIIFPLPGRLGTAFPLFRYDELVAPDTLSLAVHAAE